MFFAILSAVFAMFIGFCLSTVYIKYNITEPKAHFEKYGYKSPALAQYHEGFTNIINKYLNAFSDFDHELYNAVHTVPRDEEMVFLAKVKEYHQMLDSYKKKKTLKATDSIILHSTLNDLKHIYQALKNTTTVKTETEGLGNTVPETIQYPVLEKTTNNQIINASPKTSSMRARMN